MNLKIISVLIILSLLGICYPVYANENLTDEELAEIRSIVTNYIICESELEQNKQVIKKQEQSIKWYQILCLSEFVLVIVFIIL